MLLNQFALALCLILLFGTKMAAVVAARRGDKPRVRALQFLRLGLGLSACSYLLRLMAAPGGLASLVSLLCCLGGSLLIWIGFLEHRHLSRQHLESVRTEKNVEGADMTARPAEAGMPCLTTSAHQVLWNAATEARLRGQEGVDTDHLLLGLLTVPESTGRHILERLGVKRDAVRLTLKQQPAAIREDATPRLSAEGPPLTERAQQVFTLAAQEAHRFDRDAVGTDHLLLGLLLAGTGDAASALFREGATVDNVRSEIIKDRRTIET